MSYNQNFDLRGKNSITTYQNLIQADNTGSVWNGQGSSVTYVNLTSSYALTASVSITAYISESVLSSSYSSQSFSSTSSSWASSSISSSYSTYLTGSHTGSVFGTSSWAINVVNGNGGYNLITGSLVPITSSYSLSSSFLSGSQATASLFGTSSYSISSSYASSAGSIITGSLLLQSWDMQMGDFFTPPNFPGCPTLVGSWDTAVSQAFGGIGAYGWDGTSGNAGSAGTDNRPIYAMYFRSWVFANNSASNGPNSTNSGLSGSMICHQMRVPSNYKNGLTHSFQYINLQNYNGSISIPGSNNNVYWSDKLFVLTSSALLTNSQSYTNAFLPILVSTNIITNSFSGVSIQSGSILTATSSFNDPNGYISPNSNIFLTLTRMDPNSNNGYADYTGSIALYSSHYRWNIQ